MSCDRDFGLIEKQNRKTKLNTIHNVVNMIRDTAIKNPFQIIEMKEFIKWSEIASDVFTSTNTLQISQA